MTLLAPAALWTLAALALPLAIHLWRRPPRTVRLGSLQFLQNRPRRWRTLRWREQALLAARVGVLTALALLLAHPTWRRPAFARPQRWLLIDLAAAPAGASLDRLRAMQASGAETRLLAPGFPAVDSPPADGSAPSPDVWSLLREADAALPAGSVLTVFSPGRLASLRGIRPALTHVRIDWIDTPAAPVPADPPPPTPFVPPLTVRVLHDADRAPDARYVAAAWRAVAAADRRALSIFVGLTSDTAKTDTADWICWLGDSAVPPAVAAHAANVLVDAAAASTDATPGWMVSPLAPVRLWRRGSPSDGSVIWTDGFGQSLLTRTHDAHGPVRWHFASRFDPAWNDLPLGTALPAALRTLLAADASARPDGRLADPSQPPPSGLSPAAMPAVALPGADLDLRPAFALLAALLFGVERVLSHRRAARTVSSPVASLQPVASR